MLLKLLGHGMAACLIFGIHFVTEGRLLDVKSNGNPVRSAIVEKLMKNIHEAVNSVCIFAVLGAKELYSVKSTVNYTVAVNNKKSHFISPYLI